MTASLVSDLRRASAFTPLFLLDADEVLLHFIQGIEDFGATRELTFSPDSFALTGNIKEKTTGRVLTAAEVKTFLDDFFKHHTRKLKLVTGAFEAVRNFQAIGDVAILSNVPDFARQDRQSCFLDQGLDVPVLANSGGKGEMVAHLMETRRAPVIFVDDLPPQHSDVKKHAPDSFRLHFIADTRLQRLIPQAPDANARIDNWTDATRELLSIVDGNT